MQNKTLLRIYKSTNIGIVQVGMGMSARHGVLIKGGAALQRVSELKRVVFDKTGTLTVGKPRVGFHTKQIKG